MNGLPTPDAGPSPPPDSLQSALPGRSRWRWGVHTAIIAIFPLFALLSVLPGWKSNAAALTTSPRGLLLVCAWQLLIFGLFFGLAWMFSRATWDELLFRWRGGLWPVPLAVFYSVALRLVAGISVVIGYMVYLLLRGGTLESMEKSILQQRPEVESMVDLAALRDNPMYFWLTLTLVSFVLAGLREELWRSAFLAGLRGLWPQRFGSRAGQMMAVAVAALFFGIGHLRMGWLAVAMTTVLGVGLGIIMVLHRSIWPAVITHGLFNAATFAFLPWLTKQLPELQK